MNNFNNMLEAIHKNFSPNAEKTTIQPYEDQSNYIAIEVPDARHIQYLKAASNPTTGHEYSFISWFVEYNEPMKEGQKIGESNPDWYNDPNIKKILQIRGDHNVGFQVCAIVRNPESNDLSTCFEYTSNLTGDTKQLTPGTLRHSNVSTEDVISAVSSGEMERLFSGIANSKSV